MYLSFHFYEDSKNTKFFHTYSKYIYNTSISFCLCLRSSKNFSIVSVLIIQTDSIDNYNITYINITNTGYLIFYPYSLFNLVLYYCLISNNKNFTFLEVCTENYKALSIYFYLGFRLNNYRPKYYNLILKNINAYTLINLKLLSKNIFRQILVVYT